MPSPKTADRPTRVMFCIDNMHIGGTELNAVRTAERLDPARWALEVVCLQEDGPLLARYQAAGISVHAFPIRNLYGPGTFRQGARLAHFIRARRIDVFHAHDEYSNLFGVPWARLAGVRTIASRRWWEGTLRPGWTTATRTAYRIAHAVLANSPSVARMLHTREGVNSARTYVVPNFVDEAAFTPPSAMQRARLQAEIGLREGVPTVGIVANLHPIKDHASLLHAVALLAPRWPELQLVLVGDGSCRDSLEAQAQTLGIRGRVYFAGRRPNVPNLHHLWDVSVLCSLSEGLSNSILEAMAAGRPVVATDVGASADAVLDGETGILVPGANPQRLAKALDALLADPTCRRTFGRAARERAMANYSPAAALSALERVYRGDPPLPASSLVPVMQTAGHPSHPVPA